MLFNLVIYMKKIYSIFIFYQIKENVKLKNYLLEWLGYYIESTSGLDGKYQYNKWCLFTKISIIKYDIKLLNGIEGYFINYDYPFIKELDSLINSMDNAIVI